MGLLPLQFSTTFAAILSNGSVVTSGDGDEVGDSSEVQHQLRNVQEIHGTSSAFRCHFDKQISGAWGNMGCGGDSFAVRGQLTHVQNVQTTKSAFALRQHKSVITWGDEFWGDSSTLQNQLRCVQHLSATWRTFQSVSSCVISAESFVEKKS